MFGDSDPRRDDLGSGEPLEVAEELDPMDSDTGASDDAVDEWDDSDDQSDDVSDADVSGDDLEDVADEDVAYEDDDVSNDADDADDDHRTDDDPATAEVPYAPLDATPDVPTPPLTGDQAVDEAMMRLAESQAGSFAERIESGEHAHRSLQSRLGGLGGA
ncbi:hypothetical protein [Terracoccus sp. 273MFTsu3.1]|uniref:hypothetical protein n=1 Tax=Terracoccus sp. 273MFTsu3.1 TaxID=1172188 RepID=UPI00036E6003|nr:hypothetical protein [Terracoccus sp. 273MFTsu3.1]